MTNKFKKVKKDTDWRDSFMLSDEAASKFKKAESLYKNLIIRGHVNIIIAPPGAGKTAIAMHVAGKIQKTGKQVTYVNANVSKGNVNEFRDYASKHDFEMLLPDYIDGESMATVVDSLRLWNEETKDLSNDVIIFDTLKKMTDINSKYGAVGLLGLFRSLSAKGLTIICLADTNKHQINGEYIHDGTGDLLADTDEAIMIYALKNKDGSLTATTYPIKSRGEINSISFNIKPPFDVTEIDFIDIKIEVLRKDKGRSVETDSYDL